jgi:hypothetical protein
MTHAGTTALCGEFTLSNANNSMSNGELNCRTQNPSTSLTEHDGQVIAQAPLSLAAQATYYLNFRPQSATTTIYTGDNLFGYVNITAENAYL